VIREIGSESRGRCADWFDAGEAHYTCIELVDVDFVGKMEGYGKP
jgi:hypothetical protein